MSGRASDMDNFEHQKPRNTGSRPSRGGDVEVSEVDRDALDLAKLGKQEMLKRNFGLVSMTGFSCALMNTWEGALTDFFLGYQNGGPAGLIYGFIFCWIGTLSTFLVISELSSMYPTAGGQYHWVCVLAPKGHRKFLSYITGWLTTAGWVAASAITGFISSSLIQGIAATAYPDYDPTGWQGTLIFWAVLSAAVAVNTLLSGILPYLEIIILTFHILGFFAIMIPLIILAPHNSAEEVFTTFVNEGGWYTGAFAVIIGLNGNAGAFVGTDGAVHMSEEVKSAATNVSKSMIASVIINGALALAILLAVLFTKVDLDSVSTAAYPFIAILAQGCQSTGAALAMASLVAILQFCACVGSVASASRIMWSFAQDKALPFSSKLSRVNTRTTIPLTAILTVFVIDLLLGLINIGSTTVFDAFMSLLLEALFLSYLVVVSLLLIGRVSGQVSNNGPVQWGPWRLPNTLGLLNNIFAIVYLVIICFISFWPTDLPVTPDNMNFSVLVTSSVVIFSSIYYFVWAKKVFHAPEIRTKY